MTKDKKVFTIGEFEISSDGTQWILKTTYKKMDFKTRKYTDEDILGKSRYFGTLKALGNYIADTKLMEFCDGNYEKMDIAMTEFVKKFNIVK